MSGLPPRPALDGCVFVIFGATGDLMGRKLLPALFHLSAGGRLPRKFHVLGVSRGGGMNDQKFRRWAHASLASAGFDETRIRRQWCEQCLHYQRMAEETPAA